MSHYPAASGAITGAAFVLGKPAIVDLPAAVLALGALAGLTWLRKLPEPLIILLAGITGLGWKALVR